MTLTNPFHGLSQQVKRIPLEPKVLTKQNTQLKPYLKDHKRHKPNYCRNGNLNQMSQTPSHRNEPNEPSLFKLLLVISSECLGVRLTFVII